VLSPDFYVEKGDAREDALFEYAYECVLEKLPRAHVIDPPLLVIGNAKHKWGKFGLHYVTDTYLYTYRCIDYIIHAHKGRTKERQYMMEQNCLLTERLFHKYSSIVNDCVQRERDILHLRGNLKPGIYEQNGVTLTVASNYEFSVRGKAEKDTVFYLLSATGNPCGGWTSAKDTLSPGKYLFTTRVQCQLDDYFMQLVLTDEGGEKHWVYGNLSNSFEIDREYAYRLVRFVVKCGKSLDVKGLLSLERVEQYETQNTV